MEKGSDELNYYYPTRPCDRSRYSLLLGCKDDHCGYEYLGDKPFKMSPHWYSEGQSASRKMSKSLGNSPDPLELIDKYGADGVRMGLMTAASAGNDILFDEA